jgi:hypothetical protein
LDGTSSSLARSEIGFGENLAKRPRAAACLKPMKSEEQAVKLMRVGKLNARQEARELTNSPDATQILAAEVSAFQWQSVVQCTRRLVLPVAGAAFGSFLVLAGTGLPGVAGGQIHCVASANYPSSA